MKIVRLSPKMSRFGKNDLCMSLGTGVQGWYTKGESCRWEE